MSKHTDNSIEDKDLDELLSKLVGTPVEYLNLNAGVPEFKQALQSHLKRADDKAYIKGWNDCLDNMPNKLKAKLED